MRKEITSFFVLILLTSFILAIPPNIQTPQGFNGNIIAEKGNSNGKMLIGYVNEVEAGRAVIQNGKFDIVVTGAGGKVEFYIGTEKADETFTFNAFDVIKTNLTFGTIPQEPNHCNDGICEAGECSVCIIGDCNITSAVCINNNICDTGIGETCSNSPTDCGCASGLTCISGVCSSGTSSGGSSGGGSSGGSSSGGGGGGSHIKLSDNGSDNEITPLTTQNNNEEDETQKENSFTNFLTGAVTGVGDFVKSGNGIFVIIGGITFIVLGIAVFASRKKKPVEVKTESEVSNKDEKKA